MPSAAKMRVDTLLFDGGHVPSLERARALILAGRVLVNEQKIDKPGIKVLADSPVRLLGVDPPYVSRGGVKLAAALEHWKIAVTGRACLDVGASTGGFTDCLLQHGAAQVSAVDTGFGQIAMKLRNDPRVRLLERTKAVILVKPQFEAGRGEVGKGGIVRDPEIHQQAIDRVAECVRSLGWHVVETIPSPITGMEGNREFLLYARCAAIRAIAF